MGKIIKKIIGEFLGEYGYKYIKEDDRIYPDDRCPSREYSYELKLK